MQGLLSAIWRRTTKLVRSLRCHSPSLHFLQFRAEFKIAVVPRRADHAVHNRLVIGLLVAYISSGALVRLAGATIPLSNEIHFDPRVFTFLLAVAIATGIVFGLVPALQATHIDLTSDLKEGGGKGSIGRSGRRIRSILVIAETALALVLLVGAGLLMRTFLELQRTDSGMVTRNVLTMHVAVDEQKYDTAASILFYQPVIEKVGAIPGVRAVGFTSDLPLQKSDDNGPVTIEGRPPEKAGQQPVAEGRVVSPGYFSALGIPILRGRNFSSLDASAGYNFGAKMATNVPPPVLLINQAFARRYFANQDPIGRRMQIGLPMWLRIVGIVGDVRETQLGRPSAPTLFMSYLQFPQSEMTMVVSTTVPPTSVTPAVRAAIHSVDPNQPVFNVKTMDVVVAESVGSSRFYFWLLGCFALVALALAAAGIYGVMSYVVTQRTREIGIRMALGAKAGNVRRMVVRQGMTLVIAGLVLGTVVAFAITRLLAKLLYNVSATDPLTFACVALLLGGVALVASYIPARRAAQVDPVASLKYE